MSENTNQPNYSNVNDNGGKRNNNWLILLGLMAALLLGANIWQWSSRNNLSTSLSASGQQLDEMTKLRDEADKQFAEANIQLEEMKANNSSQKGQIEQFQRELDASKNRIAGLLKDSKNLGLVRSELATMKTDYEARLAALQAELGIAKEANVVLTGANTQLSTDLNTERSAKETVIAERNVVAAERTALQEDKVVLSKKVDIASAIRTSNIVTTALSVKGSGKEKETTSADKASRLKICFNTSQNDVVAGGREQFAIRIINPTGETMAVESQGGGIMTNSRGEQVPYSQIKELDYNNTAGNMCAMYEPGQTMKKGNYEVEIYNKGFLVGRGNFTLK